MNSGIFIIQVRNCGKKEESMKYRVNRRTGDRISEIGMGTAYISEAGMEEGVRTVRKAYEAGINYFDLAAGDGLAFPIFGEALGNVRENVFYQIHFGADYSAGTYGWSMDLETIKKSVAWMLEQLKTDYIDYGFIHCQDEFSDWETYQKSGILDYILQLKKEGKVRHIGLSSHTPKVIQKILDTGLVDMLMFSVNAAYDCGEGEYAYGENEERQEIYRRCEKEGIGISVMKPFSAGQLLDAATSPFKKAMTPYQCIRYCLDRPGILTVLPGAQSAEQIETLAAYYDQKEEDLDYSQITSGASISITGKCVYCNHCKPCPVGLDVGLINKYYDLSRAGDTLAAEHYRTLEKTADDCIGCGHCDSRCPFHVHQSERMQEISEYFNSL